MWNRAPALILAALCLAALLPAPARKVTAVPAPEWVRPLPVELRKVESIDGIEELIRDTQTWVSDDRVVSYYHTARRPVSSSALASASRISLAFDRRYQTYAWHMIRIRRGSAVIDALPSAEILQPIGAEDEDASDPDEATVTAFLRDVRVGDIVEYAASTEGEPPELRRRFTRRLNLDARTPVGLIQHRLLWPADRPLHIQALGTTLEPERTREGDRDVYVWRVLDSARRVSEPHAPSSFNEGARVRLSEFESWADVVEWARPMYATEEPVTPELERLAESFRGAGSKRDAAERATRFVQDQVRYRNVPGEYDSRPQPADLVAARRFGDCKDKSLLLITLLRLLEVEAVPVLVSDHYGASIQDHVPSPSGLDHVVVRATVDGLPVWIDSTVPYERGPLAGRGMRYGVGLRLAAGVTGLEPIPEVMSSEAGLVVHETFELADLGGSAVMHTSTLYRGVDANRRRAELAAADEGDAQANDVEFYTGLYGPARIVEPLVIRDDEARNEIEEKASYAFDQLWNTSGAQLEFWSVEPAVRRLRSEELKTRRAPLALEHPSHVVHEIDALLPADVRVWDRDDVTVTEGPGVRSRHQVSSSGSRLHVSHEYRTLAAQIGLDDLATYSSAAEEIVRRSRYHEIEPYELAAARTSPTSHAQVAEEPIYTLDFYEVELADVMRSLEVIFERPVARGGLDKGSLTLFPGAQTAKSEVIAVTSFAVSLAGLKISESQTGLKLERIPDFRGNCDRPRADVAKLLSALTRGRETASASIELAAAPAFDAIRVLSEGLSVLIAVHPRDPPVGEITLSSGPRTLPEAYAMFFAALEKQGNRVLTGPNGSLAIVGCPRESPREERVETELPRVLGTLVSQSSTLALITEGLWNRTFRAGEFFHDGKHNGKLLEIRSGAVLFEQRGRCAVLAVGEAGAGRSVECPTTPPTIDPRPR